MTPHRRAVVGLAVLLLIASCGKPHPELSPEGQRDLVLLEIVRLTNDASDAVIAANSLGKASDAITATVLTINKQILDYIRANPRTTRGQVLIVLQNARDALPPDRQAAIGEYLAPVLRFLQEAQS